MTSCNSTLHLGQVPSLMLLKIPFQDSSEFMDLLPQSVEHQKLNLKVGGSNLPQVEIFGFLPESRF